MPPIYIPTSGPDDWRWLLAKPGLHWKQGASAKSLADAWETADPWPPKVASALTEAGFGDPELLLALPEHEVPLKGGRRASQTDLFVLARTTAGLLAIAVEGKAKEPFGTATVVEWRQKEPSPGKEKRLAQLLRLLGLKDDDATGRLHYQLLHRTASAVIEARRFMAPDALMLVHSFSPEHAHFPAFADFAQALGAVAEPDTIVRAEVPDVRLHLGWVSDKPSQATVDPDALGPRFDRAVAFARELHRSQLRKATEIPYVAHLLAVASLVIEDGGDEDEAIAALLHDAVEDQGGERTRKRIEQEFGAKVAEIVQACSDTDLEPKPPWRERKEAYIAHLADADCPTLRVSLADKLHNARAMLFDLRTTVDDVWSRFNADPEAVVWYYRALAKAFADREAGRMVPELERTVNEIEALRRAAHPPG